MISDSWVAAAGATAAVGTTVAAGTTAAAGAGADSRRAYASTASSNGDPTGTVLPPGSGSIAAPAGGVATGLVTVSATVAAARGTGRTARAGRAAAGIPETRGALAAAGDAVRLTAVPPRLCRAGALCDVPERVADGPGAPEPSAPSAQAGAVPPNTAAPTPSATARPPTRPTCVQAPMATLPHP